MADKIEILINAKDTTAAAFRSVDSNLKKITASALSVKNVLVGAFSAYAIKQIGSSVIDTGAAFERMQIKLDTLSKGKGRETLEAINAWAKEMPINTREAVDVFTQMQAYGLNPTIKMMNTLVDVYSIFGGDSVPRVSRALGQMTARNKLSAQELMQLSEVGINATKYLTDAFGMSVEKIQESGISIEKVVDAIWKGLDADYSGAAKSAMNSWDGVVDLLQSNITDLEKQIAQAGLFDVLKNGIREVNALLVNWMQNNKSFIRSDLPGYFRKTAEGIRSVVSAINQIPREVWLALLGARIAGLPGAIAGAAGGLVSRLFTDEETDRVKIIKSEIENLEKANQKLSTSFYAAADGFNDFAKKRKEFLEGKKVEPFSGKESDQYKENAKRISDLNEELKELLKNREAITALDEASRGVIPELPELPKFTPPKFDKEETDKQAGLKSKLRDILDDMKSSWQEYYMTESQLASAWMSEKEAKLNEHIEKLKKAGLWRKENEKDVIDYQQNLYAVYLAKKAEGIRKEMDAEKAKYDAIKSNQDQLFSIFENEVLKEQERLTLWYEQQVAMAEANEAQIALIKEIYAERKRKLDEDTFNKQLEGWATITGAMSTISAQFGKKAFKLSQGLAIIEALMNAYAAYNTNLKAYPLPLGAIMAASALAMGLAQVVKIRSQKPPAAKKGVDYVPSDQTYQLHRGERVVPAETNKDLKAFLASGGGGVQIGSFALNLPNVRSMDDLRSMSDREWQDLIEQKMIPNFRRLAGAGITV